MKGPKRNGLNYDSVEDTEEYKAVIADVDEQIGQFVRAYKADIIRKYGEDMPWSVVHRAAMEKKRILKEQYGIDWKSEIELNPKVNFD